MADDDGLIVQFQPDDNDGEPSWVPMPIGIDLRGLLDTLKDFYLGCLSDPEQRTKYFRLPELSTQLEKLEILRVIDLDKMKAETNPVIRDLTIEWIQATIRSIPAELPLVLLANIVALEIFRGIDTVAIEHLRQIPDRQLRRELLDRLEFLVGDGFEGARENMVKQMNKQIYRN